MFGTVPVAVRKTNALADTSVAERIRQRLVAAGKRYYANDNIADFIEDGELDALREEVAGKMQAVLQSLVIDTAHDHNTRETAQRVAKMYLDEVFRGRYQSAPTATTFPNVAHLGELMVVGPITVRSACAHHLCPIMGKVWVGVLPNPSSELIGLSKYTRLCDWVMSRPQIQEEAVVMLADELERRVKPDGLAVLMEASHFCVHWRGVKDDASSMRNTVMRGALVHDAELRREFLAQVGRPAA
ncbi:MAG: GTP cyclohydrolase I [Rhodanobacter sp.]|nr:MAG: GTP cyclohydrolase I [Rhodanobacter sp.]TAM12022.1 MAG: GTP cyclohydrolase I [Rhodanobacter sp.]TAM34637.1 MAG: GTP cyclohydrolase I [Rhodanobacter sp.]